MEISRPKKLKLFYTLNQTPLVETGCLSSFYYLLAAQASSIQSLKTPLVPYHSLCSTCLTYKMSCQAIGHQLLPTQPFLAKQRISLEVASILMLCLCQHS